MYLKYIVKSTDINKTINQILKENFDFSTKLYNKLINNSRILLNNKNIDTRNCAKISDEISINLNYEEDNSNIIPIPMSLDILYEDKWLLILNKPAGIPVHPSRAHFYHSLSNGVKFYFDSINLHKKIRVVNRLDLNTSGIIVFAKNEYIQECLIKQMKDNIFYKEYIAIVEGTFEKKSGIIDFPIARKENSIIERCVLTAPSIVNTGQSAQNAITEYEVLYNKSINNLKYSIIKCHLITGRTHQIRVHMSHIGHPLLGDTMYNPSPHCELIARQALHSFKINFIHPIIKNSINIECPLPSDMNF